MTASAQQKESAFAQFDTEIKVLPRDIDREGNLHYSTYMDYLIAARTDQMNRNYKMSLDAFKKMGFSWAIRKLEVEYVVAIQSGDSVIVRTWVSKIGRVSVDVGFEMFGKKSGKLASRGVARFVLIDFRTEKPVPLPKNIVDKLSIKKPVEEENQ